MPDSLKTAEFFGVDHYRPVKVFPELETEYTNLYYACNACNSRKGNYWPSPEEHRLNVFIPNPTDHVMFDHLRYVGAEIHGHTEAGRQTIARLDLADQKAQEYRQHILGLVAAQFRWLIRCNNAEARLEKMSTRQADLERVRAAIRESRNTLDWLLGEREEEPLP